MELPARFGRYVLEERLGMGGMAEVFRAHLDDAGFQKPVCIKRVLPQLAGMPGFADMLRDEASLAARLSHTNLVQALDFGSVDGTLYIAMELVDGPSLAQVVRAHRAAQEPIPVARALQLVACMCRGLYAAHTAMVNGKPLHLIHCDISPGNVLIGRDGAVKVGDFGVARATERISRTATGAIKGKPHYMAPEQALAQSCDHRVDQFATGIVLWEMLAGYELFKRKSIMATLDAVIQCDVPLLRGVRPDVSAELEALVRRTLQREPTARFEDMRALEQAIDEELLRMKASVADIDVRALVARVAVSASEPMVAHTQVDIAKEHTVDDDPMAQLFTDSSRDGMWQKAPEEAERPALTAPAEPTARVPRAPQKPLPPLTPPAASGGAPMIVRVATAASLRQPPETPEPRRGVAAGVKLGLTVTAVVAIASVTAFVVSTSLDDRRAGVAEVARPPQEPPPQPVAAPAPQPAPAAEPPIIEVPTTAPAPEVVVGRERRRVTRDDAIKAAKLALLQGRPADAVAALAPFETSDSGDVHRTLGVAYAKLKRTQAAAQHYRLYLELNPNAADAESVREILKTVPP